MPVEPQLILFNAFVNQHQKPEPSMSSFEQELSVSIVQVDFEVNRQSTHHHCSAASTRPFKAPLLARNLSHM
jgi:hypothetical protein